MRISDWSSDVCSSDLLGAAGLNLISFIEPLRYEPATYLKDPVLLRALDSLSPEGRAAIAENLAGNLKTHVLYVSKRAATDSLAWPYGPDEIHFMRVLDGDKHAKAVKSDQGLTGSSAEVHVGRWCLLTCRSSRWPSH